MKILFVYLALLSASFAAFVNFQDAADKDRKLLQGKWEIVSLHSKTGREEPRPGQMLCQIAGDKITSKEAARFVSEASFTMDASKSPRTIELKVIAGEEKGKVFLGIYEWNGADLKMCFGPPNGARPTEFVPLANQTLIIMKRSKN